MCQPHHSHRSEDNCYLCRAVEAVANESRHSETKMFAKTNPGGMTAFNEDTTEAPRPGVGVTGFIRNMVNFYAVLLADLLDEARHVAESRRG